MMKEKKDYLRENLMAAESMTTFVCERRSSSVARFVLKNDMQRTVMLCECAHKMPISEASIRGLDTIIEESRLLILVRSLKSLAGQSLAKIRAMVEFWLGEQRVMEIGSSRCVAGVFISIIEQEMKRSCSRFSLRYAMRQMISDLSRGTEGAMI